MEPAILVMDYGLAAIVGGLSGALVRFLRYLNRPAWVLPKRSLHLYLLAGTAAGLVALALARRFGWTVPEADWVLVAFLGAAVGIGELASRYRDEPTKAILTLPATIYIALNAVAAVLALALSRHFGWWQTLAPDTVHWVQVLAAGLGAMVLLRSSVFRIHVGEQDVDVGPSSFLQSVIDAADRAVDRLRAQERAWTVARVMENVVYEKVLTILPSYISALMQNLDQEDESRFNESVKKLRDGEQSAQVKALTLGLLAMNYMGEGVLRAAVGSLATEIRHTAQQTLDVARDAAATARATQDATAEVVAAVEQIADVTATVDASTAVKQATTDATAAVKEAVAAARATVAQTQATAEAARETAAVATAATA